jgi:tellurite resistance protein
VSVRNCPRIFFPYLYLSGHIAHLWQDTGWLLIAPSDPDALSTHAMRKMEVAMSTRTASPRFHDSTAEIAAAELRADKARAFDAIVTVAALVARSDGWVHPAELSQLHEFLGRHRFQSLARVDLRDSFELRIRELREPGGFEAALANLSRYEERSLSHLVIDAGEEIAAADGRLDPREDDILRRIRIALRQKSSPPPRECHIPDESP